MLFKGGKNHYVYLDKTYIPAFPLKTQKTPWCVLIFTHQCQQILSSEFFWKKAEKSDVDAMRIWV